MRALKEHVYEALERAGVTKLLGDEKLIGTGGTLRNLAKVDRRVQGEYPISRLHGYVVDRRRLDDVTALLARASTSERWRIPGLNSDRSDSIVGGALVVQSVMDRLLASDLTVAGYGLREGVALRSVTDEAASIEDVQRAGVLALGHRFTAWDMALAGRRAALTERLLSVLRPGLAAEARSAAVCAAWLLDIGASIDHYRRHSHSARIVADANLDGYAHRTLALVAASLTAVGENEAATKGFGPLLTPADVPMVEQIAAVLALSDGLVRYRSAGVDDGDRLERKDGYVALGAPVVDTWPLETPTRRAERAFGVKLELREEPGTPARAS
jgi:exopolyphosphatase/guanosine-5'-triphosphate,3'-diphosphate pyrophosphatase